MGRPRRNKTIFKLIFLNNEKTYGDGTIMVYTRLHVLLIDINRIEIGSDSNFGGKVWVSSVDNNVWEPGATGTESLWTEVK